MIVLDDDLHKEAKAYAARNETTLTELIREALRERLSRPAKRKKKKRIKLPTFRGDGLRPGVTLDHMADVYDHMDEAE